MDDYRKRGYLLEDFRLFHLRTQNGTMADYHYHEFYKILLLHAGAGSYVVDDRRYLLQSGDVVLVGAHCVHRPELDSATPYERTIIYLSPDYLRQCARPDCDLAEIFSGSRGHVLRPGEQEGDRLFGMARALERELSGAEFGGSVLADSLLRAILVEIARDLRRGDGRKPEPIQPKNDRILQIARYIDAHLTEDLSIDELAERFYLSKYHMMRLFSRETGSTIHAYIAERRLLLARDHIRQGMSATESCYRSGFRSYCSFTRAYARRFGCTPTGRRRQTLPPDESSE